MRREFELNLVWNKILCASIYLNDLSILKLGTSTETQITPPIFYSDDLRAVPLKYRKPLNTFGHTNHFSRIHHIQQVSVHYLSKVTHHQCSQPICQGTLSTGRDSPLKAAFTFHLLFCVVEAWIAWQSKLYLYTQMSDDLESELSPVWDNKAGLCFRMCAACI